MPYKIVISVADRDLAERVVEDTQETDSICLIQKNGDELEFGVVDIELVVD